MKPFIKKLKQELNNKLVLLIYKKDGLFELKKYFRNDRGNCYDEKNDLFILTSYVQDVEEAIGVNDILQYCLPQPEHQKLFLEEAELSKKNYKTYKKLIQNVTEFENIFFRKDCALKDVKLYVAFGGQIGIETLSNAAKGNSELTTEQLDYCKNIWIEGLNNRHLQVIEMIMNEIAEATAINDTDLMHELNKIKEEYETIKEQYVHSISQISKLTDLINYWHPLLLPAPEHFRLAV